jgi:hypothetical protein
MERQRESNSPALGRVFAWVSALLAFGSVQGAIYQKSYWSRFGLDPFQYSDANALALVGLTAIGATLAFMGLAALVGGYLSSKVEVWRQKHPVIGVVVAVAMCAIVLLLAVLVDFGVYLVIGMLLTWLIVWLVHHAPNVPGAVREASGLPYIALALAYVPLGAHYLGQHRAEAVKTSQVEAVVVGSNFGAENTYRFAGKLGMCYVLFATDDGSVTIIEADKVDALLLRVRDAGR